MQVRELLTVLYFFLAIYSFTGGAVHGIANYSAWKLIGAEQFPAVHKFIDRRIFFVYVPFFFLSVLVNVVLIWLHHDFGRDCSGSEPLYLGHYCRARNPDSQAIRSS